MLRSAATTASQGAPVCLTALRILKLLCCYLNEEQGPNFRYLYLKSVMALIAIFLKFPTLRSERDFPGPNFICHLTEFWLSLFLVKLSVLSPFPSLQIKYTAWWFAHRRSLSMCVHICLHVHVSKSKCVLTVYLQGKFSLRSQKGVCVCVCV